MDKIYQTGVYYNIRKNIKKYNHHNSKDYEENTASFVIVTFNQFMPDNPFPERKCWRVKLIWELSKFICLLPGFSKALNVIATVTHPNCWLRLFLVSLSSFLLSIGS